MNLKYILTVSAMTLMPSAMIANQLVILHTNDTHSQLDPTDKNLGGILRRKALVDSVRAAEPEILLIDCGDAVQGTLYYTLYKGEAERVMMNNLGYDIQILGNHEFDNGMEQLAREWSQLNAEKLTSNYDLRGTALDSIFKPYTIHTFGNRKIGFMAINLDPKGMIADTNAEGVRYLDATDAANSLAWYLKHIEHTDMVVALTHIGYDTENPPTPSDIDIARNSKDIDIIIGGHSHTTVDPSAPDALAWKVANAAGDTVIVAQTGSRGVNVGKIAIDLPTLTSTYSLIPVDKRLDNRIDPEAAALLAKYRAGVDSLKSQKIGRLAQEFPSGSQIILNWVADVMHEMGQKLVNGPVDVAIVNKGGIRRGMPAGHITKETVMTMLPFDNKLVVMEIIGKDLKEAFDVMARRGGDGLSAGFDVSAIIPDKTYTIVTIDYLANGGDYMEPLTRGKVVTRSKARLDETMIDYIERQHNKPIRYTDSAPRM